MKYQIMYLQIIFTECTTVSLAFSVLYGFLPSLKL